MTLKHAGLPASVGDGKASASWQLSTSFVENPGGIVDNCRFCTERTGDSLHRAVENSPFRVVRVDFSEGLDRQGTGRSRHDARQAFPHFHTPLLSRRYIFEQTI